MKKIVLTRYLFEKEEVILSFITSLLKEKSIEKCYYWIAEYHYSGFDAFELLWKVYFDFYAIYYPKLESYLRKKHRLYLENANYDSIACIVKNLHKKTISPRVFLLRQYYFSDNIISHIYRGRKANWLTKYPLYSHNLLLSIHKQHWQNMCYHLKKLLSSSSASPDDIYYLLIRYFRTEKCIDLISDSKIKKKWENRMYKSDIHHILNVIVYMFQTEKDNVCFKKLFIIPQTGELDWINEINTKLPLNKYQINQNYYTLREKRLFAIDSCIGSFQLPRFIFAKNKDMKKEYGFHWEYYAALSPLWKKRIDLLGAILDHEKKTVVYKDEDIEEEFYAKFGYELDEQSEEIQEMSMREIKKKSWKKWYTEYFKENPLIIFPDRFQFVY
jgi:hypothetical protein